MAGEGKEGEEDDGGGRRGSGENPLCHPVLVKVVGTIPLLLALMLYLGPRMISEWEAYFGYGAAPTYNVPTSVLHHFRRFDSDGNGCLDPYEFQSFLEQHQPVWRSSNDSYLGDDFVRAKGAWHCYNYVEIFTFSRLAFLCVRVTLRLRMPTLVMVMRCWWCVLK